MTSASAVHAEPTRPGPVIYRVNPVAKLAATIPLSLALVLTLDWLSATVALLLELALLGWAGLGWRQFWRRTLPIWLAAPLAGLSMVLYGQASGATYVQFGILHVTDGSIAIGVATALRIVAIALPAVVLFVTIDPTDLADGLAQIVKLPARFVLGALAGLRMVGLFMDDWRSLALARRARGVADSGRLRRFAGQSIALLVLAIRRGSKLATAMEARGFGSPTPRTWARVSRFHRADAVLILIGTAIAAAAVVVSVSAGTWNFILGGS